MISDETRKMHPTTRLTFKRFLAPTCLGLVFILLTAVFMSGCVVHRHGHGYKRGHGHHHKGHIKIKPSVGVSVSPMIVIDD